MWVLTWIFCNKVNIICEAGDVKIVQAQRSKLKKEPQYKKGFFEVRTKEGLKIKPILKTI